MTRRHESYLLTPGPLTTSRAVKEAMLFDRSPNSAEMVEMVRGIRRYLVEIAGGTGSYECVPVQGSGTYACEAAFQTLIPRAGSRVMVIENGFYGTRLSELLEGIGIDTVRLERPMLPPPTGDDVEAALDANPGVTHLTFCHCDTGTGVLNPLDEIAEVCRARGVGVLVDAIASFGGFEIDVPGLGLEAVMLSPNKCMEGVPGIGFVIVRRSTLEAAKGRSPSFCLDLHAQWSFLEETGWFRFTPPTHVLLAFAQAVEQHEAEGGVAARHARYQHNWRRLVDGLRQEGFKTLLPDEHASPIIATFHDPDDPNYSFPKFYEAMHRRGFVIFPGRLTTAHTFRIGCMGDLTEGDMGLIIQAVRDSMAELDVRNTQPKPERLVA
jgi:2-aminoethylphosphonate-pyruvate transaminase